MIAITGAAGIIAAYLIAGALGYMIGVERGMDKARTKRYGRR